MRICYICDTPYQIMTCINHYINLADNEIADIYIGKHFYMCEKVIKSLETKGLFRGVFAFEFPKYNGTFDFLKKKYKEIVNIRMCLEEWTEGLNNLKEDYNEIYMSIYTHFSFGVRLINEFADVCFFDDGIGTYLGKTQKIGFKKRKIIYKVLGRTFPALNAKKIYVNNIEFFNLVNKFSDSEVHEISRIDKSNTQLINLLSDVFTFGNETVYDQRRIVFLTQPNDHFLKKYEFTEKKILQTLEPYRCSTVVRIHPRQLALEFYGFETDKNRSIWELIVLNKICDSNILVSVFSTAQFVPKILFDLEPFLIFTYAIHEEEYSEEDIIKMDNAVQQLIDIYHNKEKVYIAQSTSDLSIILSRIMTR